MEAISEQIHEKNNQVKIKQKRPMNDLVDNFANEMITNKEAGEPR